MSWRPTVSAGAVVAVVAALAVLAPLAAAATFTPQPFDVIDTNGNQMIDRNEYETAYPLAAAIPGVTPQPAAPVAGVDAAPAAGSKPRSTTGSDTDFLAAFLNSIAMILVTELGDKTFFIAAILAMQHERLVVFGGAISALAIMTVLSAVIGFALPNLLPRVYTHYASILLFAYFGIKLLREAQGMESGAPSDELEEVEHELGAESGGDVETGAGNEKKKKSTTQLAVFWQALTLTFLAEWGDRSQIATIALATTKDPFGVTFGGILGHSMCTGLAVLGGRLLASRISERTVAICGGVLFLLFAVHSLVMGP